MDHKFARFGKLKSNAAQKIAILVASGGGFVFALLLAKYWPAKAYGEFISGFSIVSYLSFPFLFGLIPQVLRQSTGGAKVSFFLICKEHIVFLLVYFCLLLVILLWWSSGFVSFLQINSLLLIVLATGVGEAMLRHKKAISTVFYVRALGMSLSVLIVFLMIGENWERATWITYFARVIPSAFVLFFGIILMTRFVIPKQSSHVLMNSEPSSVLGVVEATLIAITIGIFQYAFIIVGQKIMPAEKFVSISIGLMISVTVCQKLIEPHVFRLFSTGHLEKHRYRWLLFFELIIFSFSAQILTTLLLGGEIGFVNAVVFAIGSSFVSISCLIHYAIFIHGDSIKISAVILLLLIFLLMVLHHFSQMLNFTLYYLGLAILYFTIVMIRFPKEGKLFKLFKTPGKFSDA